MVSSRGLILGGLALAALTAFLAFGTPDAEATHFRAGTMQWHYGSTLPNPLGLDLPPIFPIVNMTMEVAFRASYPWPCNPDGDADPPNCLLGDNIGSVGNIYWGDGLTSYTSSYDTRIIKIDAGRDMIYVKVYATGTTNDLQHQYPTGSPGPYLISWESCCRLSNAPSIADVHRNNPDDYWNLQSVVELAQDNQSPVAILVPIQYCPSSGTCTFEIQASDGDGDPLEFRLSTAAEALGSPGTFYQPGPCPTCGSPGMSEIHPGTGVVTWVTTGVALNPAPKDTCYSMQIMVSDGRAVIPLDYFICMDPVGDPPTCSPDEQTVYTGDPAYFNSTGDNNNWYSEHGSPDSGYGNPYETTYDEEGEYNATVSNGNGEATCYVTVVDRQEPPPPPVCAPSTQTVFVEQVASLTATGGNGKFRWTAAGGNPSASPGPTAGNPNQQFQTSYPNPGSYTVSVKSISLTDSCRVDVVAYPPPSCAPSPIEVPLHGKQTFDGSGSGDGQVYQWSTDGGAPPGVGSTYTATFDQEGSFTVRVDSAGQSATCAVTVKAPNAPKPRFKPDVGDGNEGGSGGNNGGGDGIPPCGPVTVQFADASQPSDPNNNIVAWYWEFGDGSSSSEQNPTHIYQESGTYTTTLRVTESNGMTATMVDNVMVDVRECTLDNQAPQDEGRAGESVRDGQSAEMAEADSDDDGTPDALDNCPNLGNAQTDVDADGLGDACDADLDGDLVLNGVDNCGAKANTDQLDWDHDGQGDLCDEAPSASGCLADCDTEAGAAREKAAGSFSRDDAVGLDAPGSLQASSQSWAILGVAALAVALVVGTAAFRARRD